MIRPEHRNRVEISALVLSRARWLLDRAHSRFIRLADIDAAHRMNRIINAVDTERGRWLNIVGSTLL
jgi:hypothetical protein